MKWMPIESAPMDGTIIWLKDDNFCGPEFEYLGYYSKSDFFSCWQQKACIAPSMFNSEKKEIYSGISSTGFFEPKKWRPI